MYNICKVKDRNAASNQRSVVLVNILSLTATGQFKVDAFLTMLRCHFHYLLKNVANTTLHDRLLMDFAIIGLSSTEQIRCRGVFVFEIYSVILCNDNRGARISSLFF